MTSEKGEITIGEGNKSNTATKENLTIGLKGSNAKSTQSSNKFFPLKNW